MTSSKKPKLMMVQSSQKALTGQVIPSVAQQLTDAQIVQAQILEDLAAMGSDNVGPEDGEVRSQLYKKTQAKQEILLKGMKAPQLLREESEAAKRGLEIGGVRLDQMSEAQKRELARDALRVGPARQLGADEEGDEYPPAPLTQLLCSWTLTRPCDNCRPDENVSTSTAGPHFVNRHKIDKHFAAITC